MRWNLVLGVFWHGWLRIRAQHSEIQNVECNMADQNGKKQKVMPPRVLCSKFDQNWIFFLIFLSPYWNGHLDFWKSEGSNQQTEKPLETNFYRNQIIFQLSVRHIEFRDTKNVFVISDPHRPQHAYFYANSDKSFFGT